MNLMGSIGFGTIERLAQRLGSERRVEPGRGRSGRGAVLCRLIDDPQLRQELSRRGRLRAAEFTWQACAEQTLEVYRQVLA